MPKLNSNLWYGNEDSYFAVLHAEESVAKLQAAGPDAIKAAVITAGGGRGSDPFELPSLWQQHGNLAVLTIEGSLIDGNAGFGRLFGVIGYADIQEALAEIAMDKDIQAVLMNIDSGGGQVTGVEDTGDAIRALDKIKPVFSYTGGTMGSAAYWLGASAREVIAARTSTVGSVGTLIMHMERSKQLEDMGVKATIVRYGKFKALNNPYEPLSDEGRAQLQNLADEAGKVFVDYVSDRRGMTAAAFQKTAGEGRVFPGTQAKDVGLVDAVMNLSGAISHAKSLDKTKLNNNNPRNSARGTHMKLSKKSILAIAAGTALAQLGLAEPEANLEGVKLEGDALAAAEAEAKEVSAAIDTRVEAATAPLTTKVTELTAEVETHKTAAATAKAEAEAAVGKATLAEAAATTLKDQLAASASVAAASAEIVKRSMSVMSVALGGSADVGATLTGTELLAEHDKLAEQFNKKFPSGRVAAVQPVKDPAQGAQPVNPLFASLVRPVSA